MTVRQSAAVYFDSPAAFRRWLEAHHDTATELVIGFHKRHTGRPSLSWAESVDEALCFGWIDGIRRRVDDERYTIRFTPRRSTSIWSLINIRRVKALVEAGRMRPAGLRAFEQRRPGRSGLYSFEQGGNRTLTDAELERFRSNRAAWTFFEAQPPGYRRVATHWVLSAKREDTRARRLGTLITDSANGLRIAALRRR
jgi:uncharacterized protein YdeI (YjbR/CyaY-like superfamily)